MRALMCTRSRPSSPSSGAPCVIPHVRRRRAMSQTPPLPPTLRRRTTTTMMPTALLMSPARRTTATEQRSASALSRSTPSRSRRALWPSSLRATA